VLFFSQVRIPGLTRMLRSAEEPGELAKKMTDPTS